MVFTGTMGQTLFIPNKFINHEIPDARLAGRSAIVVRQLRQESRGTSERKSFCKQPQH